MNNQTAKLVHIFHKISLNYICVVPLNIMILINYLDDLCIRWEGKQDVSDELNKTIIELINKISNSREIDFNLISAFSEVVVSFMDELAKDEKNADDLVNIFNSMKISFNMLDSFKKMSL